MAKVTIEHVDGSESLNFKQILAIAEAVKLGGANIEEVYWKKRLYHCIIEDFYEEGYAFEEVEMNEMINRAYDKLCQQKGFPYDMNLSKAVLCKVLLLVYKQIEEDKLLFTAEDIFAPIPELEELYDNYREAGILSDEEILASATLGGKLANLNISQSDIDDCLQEMRGQESYLEDDFIEEEFEKPIKRKVKRF